MSAKSKKLIIGNWKMNPESVSLAKKIINSVSKVVNNDIKSLNVVLAPSVVYLPIFGRILSKGKILVGAQNVSVFMDGSHTGEVSARILKGNGVSYCIVGHSERRAIGETDADISLKVKSLLEEKITPVVCIGEAEHDEHGKYLDFLRNQLAASIHSVGKKDGTKIVIAYEPIWAVGASKPMQNSDIRETTLFIRKVLSDIFDKETAFAIKILYGGSVNVRNAKDIVINGEVDGLLVGRESLNPPGFNGMLKEIDSI